MRKTKCIFRPASLNRTFKYVISQANSQEHISRTSYQSRLLFNKQQLRFAKAGTGVVTNVFALSRLQRHPPGSSGNKWKRRRRMFTPAFHFRILDDFTATINAQSLLLADIIAKESLKHDHLDVVPKVTLCTLDIVCGE